MNVKETSKVLINIATSEYLRGNNNEALQYYEHALTVMNNSNGKKVNVDPETAKIYL